MWFQVTKAKNKKEGKNLPCWCVRFLLSQIQASWGFFTVTHTLLHYVPKAQRSRLNIKISLYFFTNLKKWVNIKLTFIELVHCFYILLTHSPKSQWLVLFPFAGKETMCKSANNLPKATQLVKTPRDPRWRVRTIACKKDAKLLAVKTFRELKYGCCVKIWWLHLSGLPDHFGKI